MKNKIVIIGYVPGLNGISTHVHNIYQQLDHERYDYIFAISDNYREKTEALKYLKDFDADYVFLNYSKQDFSEDGRRQLKKLIMETEGICGVHVHDVNMNIYPLLLADSLGLPVKVIQYHSPVNKRLLEQTAKAPQTRSWLSKIAGDRFCRLACSDLSGQYAYGNLPFEIMPNAVDCKRFRVNSIYRELAREKLGIPKDAPVIGLVAILAEYKNPMFAAKVFSDVHKLVPNTHMIICGTGSMYRSIRDYLEDAGIRKYAHFVGEQPQMELFYNAMDVLVLPSFMEGLPNVAIEAQATGLPCLVSDRITEMVCLTELVKRLPIDAATQTWVTEALRVFKENKKRRSYRSELKEAGYESGDAAEKLMRIYDNQRCFMMRLSTRTQ